MTPVNKAIGGGVTLGLSDPISDVVQWALTRVPGWMSVPEKVQGSIYLLVMCVVGFGLLYVTPQNKVASSTPPETKP